MVGCSGLIRGASARLRAMRPFLVCSSACAGNERHVCAANQQQKKT
jgi:hypothetical protein